MEKAGWSAGRRPRSAAGRPSTSPCRAPPSSGQGTFRHPAGCRDAQPLQRPLRNHDRQLPSGLQPREQRQVFLGPMGGGWRRSSRSGRRAWRSRGSPRGNPQSAKARDGDARASASTERRPARARSWSSAPLGTPGGRSPGRRPVPAAGAEQVGAQDRRRRTAWRGRAGVPAAPIVSDRQWTAPTSALRRPCRQGSRPAPPPPGVGVVATSSTARRR